MFSSKKKKLVTTILVNMIINMCFKNVVSEIFKKLNFRLQLQPSSE